MDLVCIGGLIILNISDIIKTINKKDMGLCCSPTEEVTKVSGVMV